MEIVCCGHHLVDCRNDTDLNLFFPRAQFDTDSINTKISNVELDTVSAGGSQVAPYVEQCRCPPGYTGLSCEKCAPGFERDQGGIPPPGMWFEKMFFECQGSLVDRGKSMERKVPSASTVRMSRGNVHESSERCMPRLPLSSFNSLQSVSWR